MSPSAGPLAVSMFAPWHAQCGIRDYSALVIEALDGLPEIDSVRVVAAPPDAAREGIASVLAHHSEDAAVFARLGASMNAAADVAHVQHQYFLFGGVAPHRSHVRAFLDRIEVPLVMTVHEIASTAGGPLRAMAVQAANRASFMHRAIRALVVHTAADRQRLLDIGVASDRIRVLRHPAPPARPLPDEGAARAVLEILYPQIIGRRVVTLFGFLSNKKGHGVALTALSHLPADVALLFAGGQHPDDHTNYVSSIQEEIDRLRLDDRVTITGYLTPEQVPMVMAITQVAVAPYIQSSGSGSLANLIAYGRAIVASDIAPHRELVDDEPGLLELFPTGDAVRLAKDVGALLANSARRDAMQSAALDYAARNTYLEFARRCVAVYRDVV